MTSADNFFNPSFGGAWKWQESITQQNPTVFASIPKIEKIALLNLTQHTAIESQAVTHIIRGKLKLNGLMVRARGLEPPRGCPH